MITPEGGKDIEGEGTDLNSLVSFLTEGCIRIAGDDVDREKAQFSWHYEPDEGVEEDRVNEEYDYLRAISKLGEKLESRGLVDLSRREAIGAIGEGLNAVSSGFFYSNTSVHEAAIASLQFLAGRVRDPEILSQIQAALQKDKIKLRILGANRNRATSYDR